MTYTPNLNYNGSDSFTFTTNDGTATSSPATVSLSINPVNDPPTGVNQTATTTIDAAVAITVAAQDVDGDPLTFAIVNSPTNGTLGTISGTTCDGAVPNNCSAQVTYTPNSGYSGFDQFTFTANDGTVDSAQATVDLTIYADSDADGIADNIDTQVGTFSNDFLDNVTVIAGKPTSGTIDIRGDRTFEITDAPAPDGVRIKVSNGLQDAQITMTCTPQVVITIPANTSYDAVQTCGSAKLRVLQGHATVSTAVNGVVTSVAINTDDNITFESDPQTKLATLTVSSKRQGVTSLVTPISATFNGTNVTANMKPMSNDSVTYTINPNKQIQVVADTSSVLDIAVNGKSVALSNSAPQSFGITASGDVNDSKRIDGFDLGTLGLAFGSTPGDGNWNAAADLNGDGVVDGSDLTILGKGFGKNL